MYLVHILSLENLKVVRFSWLRLQSSHFSYAMQGSCVLNKRRTVNVQNHINCNGRTTGRIIFMRLVSYLTKV
jgi:hypothetical protein